MFDGGLSPLHRFGDVVNVLDVPGNWYVRLDELLEGDMIAAVQAKACGVDLRPGGV